MHKGRVVFGAMDEVVFGRPPPRRSSRKWTGCAARAFLMVSGTLNRQTGEIEKIRKALGSRCVATFDAMPPHTPREAVIAAAEQARSAANADLIVTVGGGSITDGAKAVQLCLANNVHTRRGHRQDPGQQGRRAADERAVGAPDQRADDHCRRRVQRHRRRHQRAHQGQGNAAP